MSEVVPGSGILSYAGLGLRDDEVPDGALIAFGAGGQGPEVLDISANLLSGSCLGRLFKPFWRLQSLRVGKLHKNRLEDSCGPFLAELCKACPNLSELHLSHNNFTATGADTIVRGACERKRGSVLWLLLEENRIQNPQEVLNDWVRSGLPVCSAGIECSKVTCQADALVHLPYFTGKRFERRYSGEKSGRGITGISTAFSGGGGRGAGCSGGGWTAKGGGAWGPSIDGSTHGRRGHQGQTAGWQEDWAKEEDWAPAQRTAPSQSRSTWSQSDSHGAGRQNKEIMGGSEASYRGWEKGSGGAGNSSKSGADRGGDASVHSERANRPKNADPFPVPPSGSKVLNCSGFELTDKDFSGRGFQTLCSSDNLWEWGLSEIELLDFSRNALVHESLPRVVELCTHLSELKVLKLYRNGIIDAACPAIGEVFKQCPKLRELHLSHNHITDRGVNDVVPAACLAQYYRKKNTPLWLRLEQNDITDPMGVLDGWRREGYMVCKVTSQCSNGYCSRNLSVHVPFFTFQRGFAEESSSWQTGGGSASGQGAWKETSYDSDEWQGGYAVDNQWTSWKDGNSSKSTGKASGKAARQVWVVKTQLEDAITKEEEQEMVKVPWAKAAKGKGEGKKWVLKKDGSSPSGDVNGSAIGGGGRRRQADDETDAFKDEAEADGNGEEKES